MGATADGFVDLPPISEYDGKVRVLLRFAVRIAANTGALALLLRYVDGFTITPHSFGLFNATNISPTIQAIIVGGLVFALIYTFVRPVLRILSLPLLILTFGLFNVVLSVLLLLIADWLLPSIAVAGILPLIIGGLAIGVVNTLFDLK